MANTKSAEKAARVSGRRAEINRRIRTALKTFVKNAKVDIQSGDVERARKSTLLAIAKLDQAGARGYIHRNTASRSASRLERQLSSIKVDVAEEKPKRKSKTTARKKSSTAKTANAGAKKPRKAIS